MFYTIEYVLYPHEEKWKRLIQRVYAPFWRFFGMGCKAGSQECLHQLQSAGFETQLMRRYQHPDLILTHSLTEYGAVVKQQTRSTQDSLAAQLPLAVKANPSHAAVQPQHVAIATKAPDPRSLLSALQRHDRLID